nr:serum paraoxonase/arylesterase 2 [Quercus suber]
MPSTQAILGGCAAVLAALAYAPLRQRYVTLGVGRPAHKIVNIHGVDGLEIVPNTIQCEDLHLESTTNMLFAACQATREERSRWFPPLAVFTDPKAVGEGQIVRVDPTTLRETVLRFIGSPGPMVTHGIDILNDPQDPSILWIYIVNHLPDPERWFVNPPTSKAPERAQIEVFKHVLGSDEAEFVRSVRHPQITMPNDIVAITPSSFYVTNDHIYHEGIIRNWEDAGSQGIAPSTTVVFVDVTDLSAKGPNSGVSVTVALNKVHNSNGLGRGSSQQPEEISVIDASGGVLTRTKRNLGPGQSVELSIVERIQLDISLDNPSYYEDPYATAANNASGYILPGLLNAANLMTDFPDPDRSIPSAVYHVRSNGPVHSSGKNTWEKRLIFQDNGKALRSASGAIMVPIDPARTGGKKQARLFVTGFGSEAMVAAKIDL